MRDEAHEFRSVGTKYVDFVHRTDFYGSVVGVRSGEVREANRNRSDFGKVLDTMIALDEQLSNPGLEVETDDLFIIVSDFVPQDNRDTEFYLFTNRLYGEVLKSGLCCGISSFSV